MKYGSKSRVGRAAKTVSDFFGGRGITDYYGGKGSKKGAMKSAAKVAFNVGTMAAGGALGGAARAAKLAKGRKVIKVKSSAGKFTQSTPKTKKTPNLRKGLPMKIKGQSRRAKVRRYKKQ
jgi:hypothetical protein